MKPMTRRGFHAAMLTAAAAPMVVGARGVFGGVGGAGGAGGVGGTGAGSTRGRGANAQLGLGFIGVGIQGRDHLGRFLKNDRVRVVAVCDVDTTRREHARQMVDDAYGVTGSGGCAAVNDYRELLGGAAGAGVDAVVISTPDHWHELPAVAACRAKKHVFCEKPLSLTLGEAKRMMDEARKAGIVFQTGSQQRTEYDGQFRKACEAVRNGRLGRVFSVHVGVPTRGPGVTTAVPCDLPEEAMEPGLDWNRWLGPAPMRPYNSVLSPRGVNKHYPDWRLYREYSGGMLTDFGAHHFDIAQWGLGMDSSGPVEILPPGDETSMFGAKMVYGNGVEVVHAGAIGVTFICERGMIYVDRGVLRATPESLLKEPAPGKSEADEMRLGASTNHHADWLDAIEEGKRPACDVEIGARTAACCHLMNLAYEHRRPMRWDPVGWRFVAGEQGWMERAGREF